MEDKKERILRRQKRVRGKMPEEGYRLSLSRSNRFLFAQVIELKSGKTIFGLVDKKMLDTKETGKKTKVERARIFGEKFAKESLEKKVKKVIFDRGACRFHGRVKAFAEGLKSGGLEF